MGANPTVDNSDPQTTDSNETNHSTSNSSSSNSVSQPSATAIKAASKYATSSAPTSTSSNVNTTSAAVKDDTSPVTIMIKNNIASKPIKTNKLDTNGGQEQQQPRKNQNASNDHGDSNSTQAIATNKAGKLSEQQGSSSNHNPNQPLDSTTNNSQGATSSPSIRKNRENNSKTAPMIDAKDGSLEATKELDPNSDANQSGSMGGGGNYRIKKPNSSVEPVSTTSVQNSASMVDSNSTFNGLTNKLRESSSGVGGLKDQQRHQSVRNNNMRSDHGSQMSNQSNYYQQHGKSAPHQHQQQQQHYNNRTHSHQHSNQYHHHYPHQSSHNNQEQLSKTNLYIKGLSPDTNDTDLFALCSQFGNIVSTKAILDKATNKCKGYGFVDFETAEAAEYAVNELHKQGILAHMARQQEADPTNLYIANLPQVMTESELENLLRPYGQVVSTRILVNQHRQPRGVGFARMETKEQCDNIIATLNGQPIKGSEEPLLIKFADGAGKKRNHQYQHRTIGSNVFIGDNLWRNSNNETNSYTVMNSGAVNRNFHGGSFDHARQNHHQAFPQQNDTLMKHHHQMLSNMAGFQHQGNGGPHHQMHSMVHHPAGHNTTGGGHQAAQHQSPMTHHHGPNHSSNSSNHRNQNQSSPYAGGSNFPLSAQIGNSNASSQWIHTSQAHQPYVIQPQILAPTSAIDPSMHYLNLANQMQGLQIGNPAVGGFLSPQQWQVWPGTVGAKHSGPANSTNPGGNHSGYSDVD